jgi:hypothetical protein
LLSVGSEERRAVQHALKPYPPNGDLRLLRRLQKAVGSGKIKPEAEYVSVASGLGL